MIKSLDIFKKIKATKELFKELVSYFIIIFIFFIRLYRRASELFDQYFPRFLQDRIGQLDWKGNKVHEELITLSNKCLDQVVLSVERRIVRQNE